MTEKKMEEKRFSEDLDRLLAGEATAAEDAGDDYGTTVAFARRIISQRDALLPDSKNRIRSRLLARLAEQESRATRAPGRWWSQLLGNPVWRTATVTVAA